MITKKFAVAALSSWTQIFRKSLLLLLLHHHLLQSYYCTPSGRAPVHGEIPNEYRAVDLSRGEQFSPEFEHLNPLHLVPVLVDGDVVVSDSFAILLYLEEKYPQTALLPDDPNRKAINLQKYIEEKVGPEERLSWGQHHVEKGFIGWIQRVNFLLLGYGVNPRKLLKDVSGRYATGDEVYVADVFLAPQINNAITRFHVDMSKFPTLSKIYEACKVLPAFEASLPERQPDAIVQ